MRVIEVYKPCECCRGNGIQTDGYHSWDCPHCQGHGEIIEMVGKEIEDEFMEAERGRAESNR